MSKAKESPSPKLFQRQFSRRHFLTLSAGAAAGAVFGPGIFPIEAVAPGQTESILNEELLPRIEAVEEGLRKGLGVSIMPPHLLVLKRAAIDLQHARPDSPAVVQIRDWELGVNLQILIDQANQEVEPEYLSLNEQAVIVGSNALLGLRRRRVFVNDVRERANLGNLIALTYQKSDRIEVSAPTEQSLFFAKRGFLGLVQGVLIHELGHAISILKNNVDDAYMYPPQFYLDFYSRLVNLFSQNFDSIAPLVLNRDQTGKKWSGYTSPIIALSKMGNTILTNDKLAVLGSVEAIENYRNYCRQLEVDPDEFSNNPEELRLVGFALWQTLRDSRRRLEPASLRVKNMIEPHIFSVVDELLAQGLELDWRGHSGLSEQRKPLVELSLSTWNQLTGLDSIAKIKGRIFTAMLPWLKDKSTKLTWDIFTQVFVLKQRDPENKRGKDRKNLSPDQEQIVQSLAYIWSQRNKLLPEDADLLAALVADKKSGSDQETAGPKKDLFAWERLHFLK